MGLEVGGRVQARDRGLWFINWVTRGVSNMRTCVSTMKRAIEKGGAHVSPLTGTRCSTWLDLFTGSLNCCHSVRAF